MGKEKDRDRERGSAYIPGLVVPFSCPNCPNSLLPQEYSNPLSIRIAVCA